MSDSNIQTRRQRVEAREEAIIAAARDAFLESGFEGAKVAGIARRAGVAEGTLYLYFKNKNALLNAVVEAFYARLTEVAADQVKQLSETADRLDFLARHHLASCLGEWVMLSLAIPAFYQDREYRESGYFELNRTYVAVFDDVIREGASRGDIRDDLPPHLLRDLFFGALEHSARTYIVRGLDPADESAISELAGQVMAMVGRALFTDREGNAPGGKEGLEDVTRRLEAVAERLGDKLNDPAWRK
jgi:AcrR family transcriptional regulator